MEEEIEAESIVEVVVGARVVGATVAVVVVVTGATSTDCIRVERRSVSVEGTSIAQEWKTVADLASSRSCSAGECT